MLSLILSDNLLFIHVYGGKYEIYLFSILKMYLVFDLAYQVMLWSKIKHKK